MKSIILLGSLFLTLSSVGYGSPLLDDDEQFDLLRSIDDICGDTWCEGDSNWSFDDIACDSDNGCVLKLTMKPYDFSDDVTLAERPFSCDLSGFTNRTSLVEVTQRGLQYTPELYDAISECIDDLSENFGPIYVPLDASCPSLFGGSTPTELFKVDPSPDSDGIYGAIQAVARTVKAQSKIDASCHLEYMPLYRDRAYCKTTINGEKCYIPTNGGYYKVRRSPSEGVTVRYHPVKEAVPTAL